MITIRFHIYDHPILEQRLRHFFYVRYVLYLQRAYQIIDDDSPQPKSVGAIFYYRPTLRWEELHRFHDQAIQLHIYGDIGVRTLGSNPEPHRPFERFGLHTFWHQGPDDEPFARQLVSVDWLLDRL